MFFSPQEICFSFVWPAPPPFPGHICYVRVASLSSGASHSRSKRASPETKLINLSIQLQCFPDLLPPACRSTGPVGLACMSWSELVPLCHSPRLFAVPKKGHFTIPTEFSRARIWQLLLLLNPHKLVSVGVCIMGSGWTISSVRMARSAGYSGDEGCEKTSPHCLPRNHRDPAPLCLCKLQLKAEPIPPSFHPYSHSSQVPKALTHCSV